MAERLAQGDSSGAATSRGKSSAAKGRRKAGPKPKAFKPRNLGTPRAGGVQKRRGKAKAKRSAGAPASKLLLSGRTREFPKRGATLPLFVY